MSHFELEENVIKRKVAARERGGESAESGQETKEKGQEDLEKQLGAKERIEQTVVEVKNTKKRMQNIMVNMQQVISAVRAIRQQLQLDDDGDIPTVQKDQKDLDKLREKLKNLEEQIDDLKVAFRAEEINRLREEQPHLSIDELERIADQALEKFVAEVKALMK